MLPYRYLLVVLTRFLAHHPDLQPAEQRLLHRWFWRAATVGPAVAKGSTTGVTRSLCGKISRSDRGASLHRLLDAVGDTAPPLPDLRRFKTNEAAAKIALCSWWSLDPRRPDNGEVYTRDEVTVALADRSTAADAVRSVFPRRFIPPGRRVWAADRVLMPTLDEAMPTVSGQLQRRPADVAEDVWPSVLASHAITPDIERHLLDEDVDKFVEARQLKLTSDLRKFLERKCEWGFENTPPLTDLLLEDLIDSDDDAA